MENPESTESINKRKRSKTSLACAACKTRKTKCSGDPPPCETCTRLQTKCVFHPGSDMRRRDSKDHFKAYKALLEAFVSSARSGDIDLSNSLYRTIQATDSSGKLAEIAQSYAQSVNTNLRDGLDGQPSDFQYKLGKSKVGLSSNQNVSSSPDTDSLLDLLSETMLDQSFIQAVENGVINSTGTSRIYAESSADGLSDTRRACVSDAGSQTDVSHVHGHPHMVHMDDHGTSKLSPNDRPFRDYDSLQRFWYGLEDLPGLHRVTNIGLPNLAYDPILLDGSDPLSRAILEFRDGARRAIQSGVDLNLVLGAAIPSLEAYFHPGNDHASYSTWRWACEFAQSFPETAVSLQLGTIYIVGIQMRFYIYPCKETFTDLPYLLRPVRKQYTVPHAAGIDLCHLPVLKDHLFTNWNEHDNILTKLMISQDCNWPYSDSSCFQAEIYGQESNTMSLAFLEHIRELNHYTFGPAIQALLP